MALLTLKSNKPALPVKTSGSWGAGGIHKLAVGRAIMASNLASQLPIGGRNGSAAEGAKILPGWKGNGFVPMVWLGGLMGLETVGIEVVIPVENPLQYQGWTFCSAEPFPLKFGLPPILHPTSEDLDA